ncbi:hypothetical protein FHW13_003126 [Dokdonella fugitiva]|nr:hypothetical protein [Dokdonella fugitiva]
MLWTLKRAHSPEGENTDSTRGSGGRCARIQCTFAYPDAAMFHPRLDCNGRELVLDRTLVCGIVNVTADSFSDGGEFLDPARAIAHGLALVEQGADLLIKGDGGIIRLNRPRGDVRRR